MTTNTIAEKNYTFLAGGIALLFVALFGVGALTAHAATINRQLDKGATGTDVSTLQTYLSGNVTWYPSALVTGYFGPLTERGVQNFQIAQGIVSNGTPATTGFGRVGPTTLNRLNQLMNLGGQSNISTVPVLGPLLVQPTQTTLTFSWSTNEPTTGQIYWSTSPFQTDEATGPGQIPFVGGNLALDAGGLQTTHTVTISNLVPGTIYYYFMRSIDVSGDMSVVLLNSIRTSN